MKALIDMGGKTPSSKELVLECQGSSVGNYSTQWLNEFYCSAGGESAQTWLDVSKARRAKLPFLPVKILFPTARYVRESRLGEAVCVSAMCRVALCRVVRSALHCRVWWATLTSGAGCVGRRNDVL